MDQLTNAHSVMDVSISQPWLKLISSETEQWNGKLILMIQNELQETIYRSLWLLLWAMSILPTEHTLSV